MENIAPNPFSRKNLTKDILNEWQNLLNETAEILEVPAGLITRLDGREIEILLSSETEGNPYPADYVSQYPDSGWYCEYTLFTVCHLDWRKRSCAISGWSDQRSALSLLTDIQAFC